jgi:hypothetical protein
VQCAEIPVATLNGWVGDGAGEEGEKAQEGEKGEEQD